MLHTFRLNYRTKGNRCFKTSFLNCGTKKEALQIQSDEIKNNLDKFCSKITLTTLH